MATELVIALSSYVSQFWIFPFLLVAIFFLVITLFVAVTTFADVPVIPHLTDRLTANRHIATLYRLLSLALERRVPLAPVFDALGSTLPAKFLREKISVAAHDLQAGVDWIESLRRQGITTPVELGLLQAGQAAGNAGWTLRTLADRRDRYWTYRLTAITQFVFPLLMLLIGALVAVVVIGMFVPLIALIFKLA
jgi:general secretion pathway protein F